MGRQGLPKLGRLCRYQPDDSVVPCRSPAGASQGLRDPWPLTQGGLMTTCVLGGVGGGGLSYSCPKPSVSSMAYSSFSFSCS